MPHPVEGLLHVEHHGHRVAVPVHPRGHFAQYAIPLKTSLDPIEEWGHRYERFL